LADSDIDEIERKGYVVSTNGENLTSLSSLSTEFPINHLNREVLWEEVNSFWSRYSTIPLVSQFHDANWR